MGTYAPVLLTPVISEKLSFPTKIFHSWTQPKGEFILESLSQIFLQLGF